MNSIRISSNSVSFEELVAIIHDSKTEKPYVIGVAGGSASGKTTVAERLAGEFENSLLFSQDFFQLGKDFEERKTSPYKWDDPKNFDLDRCAQAVSTLKQGGFVSVPTFDVVANRRTGTKELSPANYIFWEGIYALGSPELMKNIDLSVYIDMSFEIRLLRRVKRFFATRTAEQIDDASVPARQMLTFVWRAEKVYGAVQRDTAKYRMTFSDHDVQAEVRDFTEQMKRTVKQLRTPIQGAIVDQISWQGLEIVLKTASFEIYENEICLYAGAMEADDIAIAHESLTEIYRR